MKKIYSFLIALLALFGQAQAQVTFDFSGENAYELFGMTGFSSNDSSDGDFTDACSATSGDVTITVSPSEGKNPNRMWSGSLRMYGGTLTIASNGENITSIDFVLNSSKWGEANTADSGTLEKGKWTGSAATVVITIAANTQIKSMTVNFGGGDTPVDPVTPTDSVSIDWTSSAEAPMSVATVLERAAQLEVGKNSEKDVFVKGKISNIKYAFDAQHGTATFSIADFIPDSTSVSGQAVNEFLCYGTYYLGNRAWAEGDDQINVGDEVIVCGTVTNYNGTLEMASKKNYLYALNGKTDGGVTPDPQPGQIDWTSSATAPLTVVSVLEKAAQLEQGQNSDKEVFVKGKISQIKYTFSAQYGTAQFSISDDGQPANEFLCYGTYYLGNRAWAEGDDQINVGDEVIVCGIVTNYNGTLEMASKKNYLYALNGKTDGGETPTPEIREFNLIADMQAAAQGLGTEKVAVKYVFQNAIVLGVKSKNLYITDGQRGLLLYGTNSKNLKANDVISGSITGELQLYNGVTELGNANFDEVTVGETAGTPVPVTATIADISNMATKLAYESMLVTIEDLYVVVEDGAVKAIDDSDNEVVLYDNYGFGLADLEFVDGETYNVTAIVGNFRGTIQLYPRSAEDIDGNFQEPEPYKLVGDGSMTNPYIVADVLSFDIPSKKDTIQVNAWVKGYIVGCIMGSNMKSLTFAADSCQTNIVIADAADVADASLVIPVALKSNGNARADLNLQDHPEMLGKQVWLCGIITQYMQVNGLKEVMDYSLDGAAVVDGIRSMAEAASTRVGYNLNGQRVSNITKAGIYIVNGRKVVVK